MGPQPLKNIVEPMQAWRVQLTDQNPQDESGSSLSEPKAPYERKEVSAPRLSIIVLPFTNISVDPEQEYFVDGVTESLTTDLSRIAGAFVIARNTAFTFKGKAVDVKKIGRELKRDRLSGAAACRASRDHCVFGGTAHWRERTGSCESFGQDNHGPCRRSCDQGAWHGAWLNTAI